MNPPEAVVSIGIGNGNDLMICRQGRLYLASMHPNMNIEIKLTKGRASNADIDLIVQSLERLRTQVDP